jgi:hypothetical protein
MATVCLTREEVRAKTLPAVCVVCGAPTSEWVKKRFVVRPAWVLLLLPFGGPLAVLLYAEIAADRMTVHVPVCLVHRYHWLKRTVFNLSISVAIIWVIGATIVLEPRNSPRDFEKYLLVAAGVLILIWVIGRAVLDAILVGPVKIQKKFITLRNVHPSFHDALGWSRVGGKDADATSA